MTAEPANPRVDAAVGHWRAVAAALTPVIGPEGFGALYKRSLHLAKGACPELGRVEDDISPRTFNSLQRVLYGMPGPEAEAAQASLLQTFHDLLVKLIGASLAQRLLPPDVTVPSTPEQPSAQEDKL